MPNFDDLIPVKPYMLRAIYQWLGDNGQTPYILVDANAEGVLVPQEFVKDGKIVLNISETATFNLLISNESLEFSARFNGKSRNLFVPIASVLEIFAKEETSLGLAFPPEINPNTSDTNTDATTDAETTQIEDSTAANKAKNSKSDKITKFPSHLKIIK